MSVSQSVGQSTREPAGQSICLAVGRYVSTPVNRTVGQSAPPVFEIYDEPESPDERACLRYMVSRYRRRRGRAQATR